MACQVPPVASLTNNQSLVTQDELLTLEAGTIAANLGIALVVGDSIIPVAPFIWAATAAALAIEEVINLFGGGRPKDQDTNNVIWAYNMSAYEPLHALATNLTIALRNGAPISDSDPNVQRQFSAWKQGTIESIQQQAGLAPGPSSPGYWQLQELINTSWAYSKNGQQAVLRVVEAIDCFTEVLAQIAQQPQPSPGPPPPPGPPSPPPPSQGPCVSGDPNADEILDLCGALNTNLAAILAAIQALGQPPGGGGLDPCCTAVVAAIGNVVSQLANITALLSAAGSPQPTIDLSGIVAALGELVAAVETYPPALEACCTALSNQLGGIADAIKAATGIDVSGIVAQLKRRNDDLQVDEAWKTAFINSGAIPPELASLIQGTTTDDIRAAMSGFAGYTIGAGIADPDTAGGRILAKIVIPFGRAIWQFLQALAAAAGIGDSTLAGQLGTAAKNLVGLIDTAVVTVFGGVAGLVLEGYESGIAGVDTTTDAGVSQVVQTFLGRAFELGMGAHMIAMLPELAYFTKSLGLNASAALLAELAGFHEVMIQVHRPFMTAALGRPATYLNNRNYPTTMPVGPAALALWARRKISDADAQYLMASAGYNARWQAPEFAGAYRPVQPRTLVQLFLDQPIDQNVLTTMLRDTALSENNVALMSQAITYKSISNVRNSYLSALISGYGKGVVGDDELQEALTEFNFSPQAQQYVKAHVLILRREVLAQEAESTIVPLVANGGMAPDVGLQQLEIAGLQPWLAQLKITLATTKADIAILKKELALEAKTLLQEQRNATRAAIAEFQRGLLDETGLTAALTAIGLDPVLIASVVAVQDATRTGRMKFVYGQLLSPANARVLTERVGAIETQVKEELITTGQALAQLKQLGVDDADANAIVARAIAALGAASTRGTLLSPITGQPP